MRRFVHTMQQMACWVALALLAVGWAMPAQAQAPGEVVQWTAEIPKEAIAPGAQVPVRVTATIADGWKMYAPDSPPPSRGVQVRLDSLPDAFTSTGTVDQAPPKEGYDPNFDKVVRYYESEATLTAYAEAGADAAEGEYTLGGTITFMVCNDRLCLPPTQTTFAAAVNVSDAAPASSEASSEASARPPVITPPANGPSGDSGGNEESGPESEASAAPPASTSGDLDAARTDGLLGFLLLAIGAGAAALLTPCVFPMIPLTVSYFTKHSESRAEAVRMAGVYGTSIVLTFTGLGVAMALILGAAGAQTIAANPWVNLFIGSVFVFFALSLLGLFDLKLPSGFVNYVNRQGNEQAGYVGVLFMGLTLTLVSFSCTAPFVGGLLAATTGGEWTYPVIGMLAFSATFALPFVFFALFPKGLNALPKSGQWMGSVKVVLGFVELAAALKFLSNADLIWGWNLLTRPLAIALTIVIFFLTGLYLIGKLRMKHESATDAVGSLRLLAAVGFFGLALYLVPGLLGAPLGSLDAYLPPRRADDFSLVAAGTSTGPGTQVESDLDWYTDDLEGALAQAKAEDKPLFIDFTGYTCTNCRDMEANVFPKPAVAERFERDFVLLRLYTDDMPKGTEYQRYQLRLTGTTALPTYAIVDPDTGTLIERTSGTMPADEFAAFLAQGASTYADDRLASNTASRE